MSRSGYVDDCDDERASNLWRGAVARALSGKRGLAFLREMARALDAMPEKRLIAEQIVSDDGGACCALGSVALARGEDLNDLAELDAENYEQVGRFFGVAAAFVREVAYLNDEGGWKETPEQRWQRMRRWVGAQLGEEFSAQGGAQ